MQELLQKPFLTNTDIMAILGCSSSKASRIRGKIKDRLNAQGKVLMTGEIPTKEFLDFMCYS